MLVVFAVQSWLAAYTRSRLGRGSRGSSLVEYVLLLMLIAMVCVGILMWFGGSVSSGVSSTGSSIAA
jgi:Flp pilus assembly pilin Flp